MSEVVTTLSIDAETSGADQFIQKMGDAKSSAEGGTQSLKDTALAIAGVSAGMIGAVATVTGFVDYIVKANAELANMAKTANQVGLTLAEFQGIQLGGQISGLSTDQINTGLEKSAQLLNDASRNSNSLSKELDANGISVKNANGQLISENQLLGIAADLIKRANNPGDQLVIAQMLGFTKEWVPLLEQGSGAMSGLAAEAEKAGAVIDQSTIDKATDFDTQWRKSSIEFSTYMKAALTGLLPFLDDLIEKTSDWIKTLPTTATKTANATLGKIGDQTGDSVVLHVETDNLTQAFSSFQNSNIFSTATWVALGSAFSSGVKIMTPEHAAETIPGYAASQITEPTYPTEAQLNAAFDKWNPPDPGSKAHPLAGLSASDYDDGASKVASKGVGKDAVQEAIDALNKHTLAQQADADAVGLGAAQLAIFRAQAQETAAVAKNGGNETAEQATQFKALQVAAGNAADALAKAKVASDIQFAGGTAFLSANDVAIATQLKGIYGNDIPAALSSTYAASIRVNDAMKEIGTAMDTNLASGLTDIVTGTKSVSQGFSDMGLAIVKALDQAIIKLLIVQPLMRSLQSGLSGLGFGGASAFSGAVNANGSIAGAAGATSVGGAPLISAFAGGTDSAPGGWAVVGENGPELMRVPTGAQILPNGKSPSNDNGGSGSISVGDVYVTVPDGTSAANASAVGSAVKQSVYQAVDERLRYHTRQRGMLNSGS